ncbi:DUF2625 family protein [Shigella boydii]
MLKIHLANNPELVKRRHKPYQLLPVNKDLAETALFQLQVTTKSPMGALVYGYGGLLN